MTVRDLKVPRLLGMRARQDWNLLPVLTNRLDQRDMVCLCFPDPIFDEGRFKLFRLNLDHSLSGSNARPCSLGILNKGA